MPITIEGAVEEKLRTELMTVQYQSLTITNQESYDHAIEVLGKIKTWRKRWLEYWEPLKQSSYRAWKDVCAKHGEPDKEAEKSEAIVKAKLMAWDDLQQKIQEEKQREADRIAREKAEADRQAQIAEMEEMEVSEEDIQAVVEAPVVVEVPVVAPTYQKAAGVSTRDTWCAQVTDLKALCKAIGGGKFKLSPDDTAKAVEFFESLLKKQATANQTTLNIPGVKAVNRPIMGMRGR